MSRSTCIKPHLLPEAPFNHQPPSGRGGGRVDLIRAEIAN